ncbi:hypothetical protein [Paraburkholderia kirstenboschensis]|uniref:hypothetical protein n=1 Tax=Paraburkholderia kirstenboschensis TaxID=1245436 RepID=UPI001FB2E755|nr:hypothetical protein [Paraburkholderia kirstenboschensis]
MSAEPRWHLTRLCCDDRLVLDGLVVIHAPGRLPNAEINYVAIALFGVFLVETMHWAGVVTHGETDDTLILTAVDGQRLPRASPASRMRQKCGSCATCYLRGCRSLKDSVSFRMKRSWWPRTSCGVA